MTFDPRITQIGSLFSEMTDACTPLSPRQRRARREALFAESPARVALRHLGDLARALGSRRVLAAPATINFFIRQKMAASVGLPDPARALARPDGLCGLVGDISLDTLIEGYAQGLYPSSILGPRTWWSPARRMVVRPGDFAMTPAARRLPARWAHRVTFDRDFENVLINCVRHGAATGGGPTLSPATMHQLAGLHDLGIAHSFEVRDEAGHVIAGGFGLALGRVYVTQGTYGATSELADFGLGVLNRHLARDGFALHEILGDADAGRFGFTPMARADYLAILATHTGFRRPCLWRADPALCHPGARFRRVEAEAEPRDPRLERRRREAAAA